MTTIHASTLAYETWLHEQLGPELVEDDLRRKHGKMRDGAFPFLRATYWRWAETILEICPDLAEAPRLLAIGDTHLENFGTWRDAEGRLIWGANDFDDAAVMPWPLDLVRLAASALLARRDEGGPSAGEIGAAILAGYKRGFKQPCPVVLEQEHADLRKALLLSEKKRARFWCDIAALKPPRKPVRPRYRRALHGAMPEGTTALVIAPRSAGTGSLGRPRFVAHGTWLGGPVVREVKALLTSAWALHHGRGDTPIRAGAIAGGRHRSPDPHYRAEDGLVVRRLSPNSRKIEVEDKDDARLLLSREMLEAMGKEIATCHAGDRRRLTGVRDDLKRRGTAWLHKAAEAAAAQVAQEQRDFVRGGD